MFAILTCNLASNFLARSRLLLPSFFLCRLLFNTRNRFCKVRYGRMFLYSLPIEVVTSAVMPKSIPTSCLTFFNGVIFRSHTEGSAHYFTPEKSIDIQHNLGADIIFAFDECTSPNESDHYQAEALDRTHRWAKQSLEYHKSKPNAEKQALFGIVQGGRSERRER